MKILCSHMVVALGGAPLDSHDVMFILNLNETFGQFWGSDSRQHQNHYI